MINFCIFDDVTPAGPKYRIQNGSNTCINLYFFLFFTKHSDLEPKKCRKMILIKFLGRKMNQRQVLQQFHGIRKRKKMTNMLSCKFDEKISARAMFSNLKLLYYMIFFLRQNVFFFFLVKVLTTFSAIFMLATTG